MTPETVLALQATYATFYNPQRVQALKKLPQKELNQRLFNCLKAVQSMKEGQTTEKEDCTAELLSLLLAGADPNAKKTFSTNWALIRQPSTPLQYVGTRNDLMARLLLDAGANWGKNEATFYKCSFLHFSARIGHLSLISRLLEAGANVDEKDEKGDTSLHLATYNGHLKIVSRLLLAGAKIDEKDNEGCTPLRLAAYWGHLEVVSRLLEADAKIDEKDNEGHTPLHSAAQNGHLDVVSRLVQAGANIDEKDKNQVTALHRAAYWGHLEVVSRLLEAGANPHEKDEKEITPLHRAAQNGQLDVVSRLVQAGANIDEKCNMGRTALHSAAQKGHLDVVSRLVQAVAKIDEKDNQDCAPLHLAAAKGHLDVVSRLLQAGANIDEKDNAGYTPLHLAAKAGHLSATNLLLAAGAKLSTSLRISAVIRRPAHNYYALAILPLQLAGKPLKNVFPFEDTIREGRYISDSSLPRGVAFLEKRFDGKDENSFKASDLYLMIQLLRKVDLERSEAMLKQVFEVKPTDAAAYWRMANEIMPILKAACDEALRNQKSLAERLAHLNPFKKTTVSTSPQAGTAMLPTRTGGMIALGPTSFLSDRGTGSAFSITDEDSDREETPATQALLAAPAARTSIFSKAKEAFSKPIPPLRSSTQKGMPTFPEVQSAELKFPEVPTHVPARENRTLQKQKIPAC